MRFSNRTFPRRIIPDLIPFKFALNTVLLAVGAHLSQVLAVGTLLLHVLHDVGHGHNGLDRDTEIPLDLLDSRHVAVLASLLAIYRHQNTRQLGLAVLDDLNRLADGGTGGDNIVNDQDLALQCRSDNRAALAMILLFLAVEAVRRVLVVRGLSQGNDGGAGKRDTLVGGAKDDVVLNARVVDGSGVELSDLGERSASVEETCVQEVGRDTAGLEGELSELQDLVLDGKLNELALVILDGHGVLMGCGGGTDAAGGRGEGCGVGDTLEKGKRKREEKRKRINYSQRRGLEILLSTLAKNINKIARAAT